MDDIEADRLYKYPDVGIMVNLGFCLVVSVPLFAAFCFLRKRIFRIYDANLANRNRYPHRFPHISNGCLTFFLF